MGNFIVPSIYLEVLAVALAVPPRLYHVIYYLLGDEKYLFLEGIGLGPCYQWLDRNNRLLLSLLLTAAKIFGQKEEMKNDFGAVRNCAVCKNRSTNHNFFALKIVLKSFQSFCCKSWSIRSSILYDFLTFEILDDSTYK